MAAEKFPFFYDADKMKEFFTAAKLPAFDADAVMDAQRKNMDALIEANKAVMAGYQEVFKRQAALAEAAVAQTKDKINEIQGQPLSTEQFSRNGEAFQTAVFEAGLDEGIVTYPGGTHVDGERGDHVLVTPPLTIDRATADEIVARLDATIARVEATLDAR